MPAFFKAEDSLGTIHYSRFTLLSNKTLLFLGDFDGEFGALMSGLAKSAGPVFDAIFQHVDSPPITPVANNVEAFVEWTADHLVGALNLYTAYPGVTASEIKALAANADVTGATEQRPFLVVLPIKSKIAFIEVQMLLRARGHGTTKDLDKVGTPHFAQFVALEDNQIGFFTVYDGTSTITLRILQRTSDKCLTCCSSLQPARHLRLSGNTSRNLSTLRPGRTALRSGSTKPTQA